MRHRHHTVIFLAREHLAHPQAAYPQPPQPIHADGAGLICSCGGMAVANAWAAEVLACLLAHSSGDRDPQLSAWATQVACEMEPGLTEPTCTMECLSTALAVDGLSRVLPPRRGRTSSVARGSSPWEKVEQMVDFLDETAMRGTPLGGETVTAATEGVGSPPAPPGAVPLEVAGRGTSLEASFDVFCACCFLHREISAGGGCC